MLPSSQHQHHRTVLRCLRLRNREIAPSFKAINSRISHSNVHCCLPASVACTSPLSDEKLNKHYSATPPLFGDSISVHELFDCCETLLLTSFVVNVTIHVRGVSFRHIVTLFVLVSKVQQQQDVFGAHWFVFCCATAVYIADIMSLRKQYKFDRTYHFLTVRNMCAECDRE